LKDVATRHYVKIEPDLNSEATAGAYVTKRLNAAGDNGDKKGIEKWDNMMIGWSDLDGKPETPDNLIIRNKDDPNDLLAIDGLRLVDRTKSVVKRGVYDIFPTKEERVINKELIDQIYKKYLRKYLTQKERDAHPWGPEMAAAIDQSISLKESAYTRIRRGMIGILNSWGVKCKADNGRTILTTPHWGYLTSKVASDFYRGYVLPGLMKASVWRQKYPNYDLVKDPLDLLNNKAFTESMLAAYMKVNFNPDYMGLARSLQTHSIEFARDGVRLKAIGVNGDQANVWIQDLKGEAMDQARLAKLQQPKGKKSRSIVSKDY
jgi:hypothetical protein